MNIQNAEAKIGAVHEVGCRLDDSLEAATKDLYRAEGAASAVKQIVSLLENLMITVDKDVSKLIDEGTLDLEQAKLVKGFMDKARLQVANLSSNAENNKIVQSGKVQAFQQAVQVAKKFKDDEMNKLKMLADAITSGKVKKTEEGLVHTGEGMRPEGVHPGMSIKERRLAEVAAVPQEKTLNLEPKDTNKKDEKPKSKAKKEKK